MEAAGEDLGAGEREWEALVLSLRTTRGVPVGVVPDELFDSGLVVATGSGAVLTPRGRLLANEVALRLRPFAVGT